MGALDGAAEPEFALQEQARRTSLDGKRPNGSPGHG